MKVDQLCLLHLWTISSFIGVTDSSVSDFDQRHVGSYIAGIPACSSSCSDPQNHLHVIPLLHFPADNVNSLLTCVHFIPCMSFHMKEVFQTYLTLIYYHFRLDSVVTEIDVAAPYLGSSRNLFYGCTDIWPSFEMNTPLLRFDTKDVLVSFCVSLNKNVFQ